jgi:activating signal cointegrator 1
MGRLEFMKAITLHQPWATLMAMGVKTIETRSWSTRYRGPLAIHAAKTFPAYAKDACYSESMMRALGWPLQPEGGLTQEWLDDINARMKALPLGVVVGVCELVTCFSTGLPFASYEEFPTLDGEKAFGDYSPNRFGWVTFDMKPFAEPIPAVGMQGLWDWKQESTA